MLRSSIILLLLLAACDRKPAVPVEIIQQPPDTRIVEVDGRRIVVGSRDVVRVQTDDEVFNRGGTNTETRRANTKGVGLTTNSESAAQKFKAENAQTGLDDIGSAAGGGFQYEGTLLGGMKLNVFHLIGAACMLGGLAFIVVPLILKQPPRIGTGAALAGGGVAFIAIGSSIETMPFAWALGGLLVLAGLGFWLFMALKSGKFKVQSEELADSVVTTVSSLDDTSRAAYKAKMSEVLKTKGPRVKARVEAMVTEHKNKLNQ
jgi:hypothetical protein